MFHCMFYFNDQSYVHQVSCLASASCFSFSIALKGSKRAPFTSDHCYLCQGVIYSILSELHFCQEIILGNSKKKNKKQLHDFKPVLLCNEI